MPHRRIYALSVPILALSLGLVAALPCPAEASPTSLPKLCPDSQHGGTLLAILCYHHVDSALRTEYGVTSAQLSEQLDALEKEGFSFVSGPQVEAFYAEGSPLPQKSALITFDDGNLDIYTHAFPLLQKRGIPFVFYVYPAAVNLGHAGHCVSWDDLRDMASKGVTIGCHSMDHPILTSPPQKVANRAAYDAWLDRQLVQSKTEIEANLGQPVREFAVPFGAFDRYVYSKIKAAGYALALNVHGAIADSRADPFNLNRLIVLRSMSTSRFLELATSPPLYFDAMTPGDLSRVETEYTDVSFEIDGADSIDETSVKSHVSSFPGLKLRHLKEGDRFVESVDLKRPAYYAAQVSARDRAGRLCRGAWLFLYDKTIPLYLKD
jgi:peptidoglycan/xylan/chitin deacetylase (PgdA/CDA1 family)